METKKFDTIHNQDHISLKISIEMKIQEWEYEIKKPHLYAWDLKYFTKAKR